MNNEEAEQNRRSSNLSNEKGDIDGSSPIKKYDYAIYDIGTYLKAAVDSVYYRSFIESIIFVILLLQLIWKQKHTVVESKLFLKARHL